MLLSVPSTLTPALVKAVLGEDAEAYSETRPRRLVTEREPNELEIHPLCRAFLEQKIWVVGVAAADRQARDEPDRRWPVGRRVRGDPRVRPRRATATADRARTSAVLAEGRHNAIDLWVTFADQRGLELPEVALARAEMLLRRGNWEVSEVLASRSAKALTSPELVAEAHLCAGSPRNYSTKSIVHGITLAARLKRKCRLRRDAALCGEGSSPPIGLGDRDFVVLWPIWRAIRYEP